MDARCAFHQNQPATFTCERCGNFGCELCRSLSRGPRCAACYAKAREVVRVEAPVGLDLHQLVRESLARTWARRRAVLPIAALQAIPWAYMVFIYVKALMTLGPPFDGTTFPTSPLSPDDLNRVSAALDLYRVPLYAGVAAEFVIGGFVTAMCTALFAAETPAGGVGAVTLRKYFPVLGTTLLAKLILNAAIMMCCLPAIPASAVLLAAAPLVVLGGQRPFGAIRGAVERVLPQVWVVVGAEVLLGAVLVATLMVTLAIGTPLELVFGTPGTIASLSMSVLAASLLSIPRFALGVLLFEKLKGAPTP